MNSPVVRALSGALAIAFGSAPTGATTVGLPTRAITPAKPATPQSGRAAIRHVQVGKRTLSVTGPIGCSSDGNYSFIGNNYPYYNNYAGGEARGGGGFSSVVNGYNNASCDQFTAIVGGENNTIGGDGGGSYSLIGAGAGNSIEGNYDFIGNGDNNTIGTSNGNTSEESAIVSGGDNSIAATYAFIGGGYANSNIGGYYSSIGGGYDNFMTASDSAIGGGQGNSISGQNSVVAGGYYNSVSGAYSIIGGGQQNSVAGEYAAIGGGYTNNVSGQYSAVAGGYNNSASGSYANIAGGSNNTASGSTSSVLGGYKNVASGLYAVIPGGISNTGSGFSSFVAGGSNNTASGRQATTMGGEYNVAAGQNSFAAGTSSNASTAGTFVWSDDASGAKAMTPTATNQFFARASGGFYLYSSAALKSGVSLAPGSGAWSTLSDRNVKNNVQAVDPAQILARLDAMPVSEWSYDSEGTVRHLGPMAQDFRQAFNLGEDDTHISTVDEEGVALAAIKALKAENDSKDRQISELRDAHRDDQARLSRLEARLDDLEAHIRRP